MLDKELRILILTSTKKDGSSTEKFLSSMNMDCFVCASMEHLIREMEKGAGALVLAREILTDPALLALTEALSKQPSWSHLPMIVFMSSGDIGQWSQEMRAVAKRLRNKTFLERPVRLATLISVLEGALADRRRQYEARNLLQQLNKSKDEADRANRSKSEFLANMSHEIRTPLGAVLGFAELLMEERPTKEEKTAFMRTIKRNGQVLSTLIDDILDLAKVESGRMEIEQMDVPLDELVAEVISSLEPRAQQKKISLSVSSAPGTPDRITTDPTRFKQILTNIIGNAIKFTAKGGILVKIYTELDEQKPEAYLAIEVVDSGIGISEEQSRRLFQPFSQADTSTTRAYGGTGLGLALSRQLAHALGGDLTLDKSIIGAGSTFKVTIGMGETSFVKSVPRQIVHDELIEKNITGTRVLVVEDSPDNQELISRLLTMSGAEVELASDGQEGIEKALNNNFDVVLMDVQMPRLGGHDATRTLREKGYRKPIIALTAHALKEDRMKSLEAGCDEYLSKPIDRRQLLQTIASCAQRT